MALSRRKWHSRSRSAFSHDLPAILSRYWLPVDTRLTPSGNQVRLMTHLHGGFVAADSDGNPAITPDGFGPRRHADGPLYKPAAADAGNAFVVSRSRSRHHATQCVCRIRGCLFPSRRVPDTGGEPNPIGVPGGAYEIPLVIQDRQFTATESSSTQRKRHRRRDLDWRVLRRRKCWSTARSGHILNVKTAHVSFSDLERLQRANT